MAKNIRKRIGASKDEEALYLASPGISASGINTFLQSPIEFHNSINEDTDQTVLGSAIHCNTLQPSLLKEKFSVISRRIEGLMGNYLQLKAEAICNGFDDMAAKEVARLSSGFKIPLSQIETTINKPENGPLRVYYASLLESKGKFVMDTEEETTVKACTQALNSHKKFTELLNMSGDHIEVWIEHPIIWTMDGKDGPILCRSKPDIVVIDHKLKIIYVLDIKTTSKRHSEWNQIIRERGYHRQLSFYCGAVERKLWQDSKAGLHKKYTWIGYIAMVETQSRHHQCKVKVFSDTVLHKAYDECVSAVEDMMWHKENNLWEHTKDYYEGDGTEEVDPYNTNLAP